METENDVMLALLCSYTVNVDLIAEAASSCLQQSYILHYTYSKST